MALLTRTERAFLTRQKQFSRDQQYYIRSRLLKKIKALYGIEVPLLDEKRYLAASCKVLKEEKWSSLVRISSLSGTGINEMDKKYGGPDMIRTRDPRHVKVVSIMIASNMLRCL